MAVKGHDWGIEQDWTREVNPWHESHVIPCRMRHQPGQDQTARVLPKTRDKLFDNL